MSLEKLRIEKWKWKEMVRVVEPGTLGILGTRPRGNDTLLGM